MKKNIKTRIGQVWQNYDDRFREGTLSTQKLQRNKHSFYLNSIGLHGNELPAVSRNVIVTAHLEGYFQRTLAVKPAYIAV